MWGHFLSSLALPGEDGGPHYVSHTQSGAVRYMFNIPRSVVTRAISI